MLGVANGDCERIGGVRRRRGRGGKNILTIIATCRFSACPAPTTVFLTRLAAYSATGKPVSASDAIATPRACPSFSADCGSRLTNVSSIAASWGSSRSTSPMSERWIAASRSASEDAASVPIEPQLRKLSRDPAASITPHPVVRKPGSTPRMRIAAMVMACLIYEFPRRRIWMRVRAYRRLRQAASSRSSVSTGFRASAILALALRPHNLPVRTVRAIREERREVGEEAVAAAAPAATAPHFDFEREAIACGHRWVAGVDEVGRGPLAGPCRGRGGHSRSRRSAGGARRFRRSCPQPRANRSCEIIFAKALSVSIVFASVEEIDAPEYPRRGASRDGARGRGAEPATASGADRRARQARWHPAARRARSSAATRSRCRSPRPRSSPRRRATRSCATSIVEYPALRLRRPCRLRDRRASPRARAASGPCPYHRRSFPARSRKKS